MRTPDRVSEGSILLPVIVVLLLIASAATAMTLQARTSLREAAIRRDRLALGFAADGAVRAAAMALEAALAGRTPPPFPLDGSPQTCALARRARLVLSVQDEGGLVDLNKASEPLLMLVLQRAGLSGWDANTAMKAITRRRGEPGGAVGASRTPGFRLVDEVDDLPGMTTAVLDRLGPALSVLNGAAGIDPTLVGPGLAAMISPKEFGGPAFQDMRTPSRQTAFTLTATAVSPRGTRVERRAALRRSPDGSPPQFVTWDATIDLQPFAAMPEGAFCTRVAAALGPA